MTIFVILTFYLHFLALWGFEVAALAGYGAVYVGCPQPLTLNFQPSLKKSSASCMSFSETI